MNANLTKPVEDQEVKIALFSMYPYKAASPYGMSPFSSKNTRMWLEMIFVVLSKYFFSLKICYLPLIIF